MIPSEASFWSFIQDQNDWTVILRAIYLKMKCPARRLERRDLELCPSVL